MAARVGIRDLRNRTAQVVEMATKDGEVVITNHGEPVAVLRPYVALWKERSLAILRADREPSDSGLTALLAADDADSLDDLA